MFLWLAACAGESTGGEDTAAEGAPTAALTGSAQWPLDIQFTAESESAYDRVVLVSIDTLRADHVSSYGYRRPTTPFIDTLASRGVLFEKAMASVSHTAPSHASMLTGLPPVAHGVLLNGDTLEPDALDLGKVYSQAGFETAAFLNTGFLASVATAFDHKESFFEASEVVDGALAWLDGDDRSDRFFLWIHSYAPHRWTIPHAPAVQDLRELRAGTDMDEAEQYTYLAELMGLPNPPAGEPFPDLWKKAKVLPWLKGLDSRRAYLDAHDGYDALILHADRQIERLYRGLEERGLGGRVLWIITSDHGEGIGSHGVVGHGGHVYQEQLHVPLIFHAMDDSLAPRRVSDLVQHVDLFPTLVESLGARTGGIEPARTGASLWPLIRGEVVPVPRMAFAQRRPQLVTEDELKLRDEKSWNAVWSLQTLESKYILRRSARNEFYDLKNDPLERSNLFTKGGEREALLAEEIEHYVRLYLAIRREAYGGAEGIAPEVIEELRALGYVE